MNEHVATYPKGDKLEGLWLTPHISPADEVANELLGTPLPNTKKLNLTFRRTAIGMAFDPLFITVIGERHFEYMDSESTLYIVLDEAIDTENLNQATQALIELKDKYRVRQVFVPEGPVSELESIKRLEGLTYYSDPQIEASTRTRFPTFVDFDLTSSIVSRDIPTESVLASQINDLLSEPVLDPRTEMEMVGADGTPIHRLLFLDDFPMFRTLQSVRTNSPGGSTALWLATSGLTSARIRRRTSEEIEKEKERFYSPNRNKTGY